MPFVGYTALSTSLSMTFFFSSRRRHTRCLSDWSSDVCSSDLTKREIMAQAAKTFGDSVGQRFLAGHPMAGKEYSGVEMADPELFQDATWFVTPSPGQTLAQGLIGEFLGWVAEIGADIQSIDAA